MLSQAFSVIIEIKTFSGMATGIDGEAHIGALEVGGETIAVCGAGLDRIYPAIHRALAHQIFEQGVVLVRDT